MERPLYDREPSARAPVRAEWAKSLDGGGLRLSRANGEGLHLIAERVGNAPVGEQNA